MSALFRADMLSPVLVRIRVRVFVYTQVQIAGPDMSTGYVARQSAEGTLHCASGGMHVVPIFGMNPSLFPPQFHRGKGDCVCLTKIIHVCSD